jgi:hypothetical protein
VTLSENKEGSSVWEETLSWPFNTAFLIFLDSKVGAGEWIVKMDNNSGGF